MVGKSIYNTNSLSNQFLKECIHKNQIESNNRKRIFLTPHAGIQESHDCAILTLQYLPKNPNKIIMIATNHGYIPNENIEIKEENDIKNFLEKEHSARINTEIIYYLRKNFQSNNFIYRVYSKKKVWRKQILFSPN
jgi:predicted class III extradiol MEMO1 family dioxygenase